MVSSSSPPSAAFHTPPSHPLNTNIPSPPPVQLDTYPSYLSAANAPDPPLELNTSLSYPSDANAPGPHPHELNTSSFYSSNINTPSSPSLELNAALRQKHRFPQPLFSASLHSPVKNRNFIVDEADGTYRTYPGLESTSGLNEDTRKQLEKAWKTIPPAHLTLPLNGQSFQNPDECAEHLQHYAFSVGFAIVVTSVEKGKRKRWGCVHHGTSTRNTRKLNEEKKTRGPNKNRKERRRINCRRE